MDGILGANVTELRDFARLVADTSDVLRRQSSLLSDAVNQRPSWFGPDAERFRSMFNGSQRPALASAAAALERTVDTLTRNADEQERASRADGGSTAAEHRGRPQRAVPRFWTRSWKPAR